MKKLHYQEIGKILFNNWLIAHMIITVFKAVLTGITNGMILAKSQSAIFILILYIAFFT